MNPSAARPAVVTETALDESFLLGTKEQLINFARSILRAVESPMHQSRWNGVTVQTPSIDQSLTEPMSEVVIRGISVVENENDRRVLVNYFRAVNGDTPIDWVSHDDFRRSSQS